MMMKTKMMFALAVIAPWAQAHVTLEQKQAPAGSYYKAVVQVTHGCAGSAMTAIRVQIPEGVPTAGQMPGELDFPAPTLELLVR